MKFCSSCLFLCLSILSSPSLSLPPHVSIKYFSIITISFQLLITWLTDIWRQEDPQGHAVLHYFHHFVSLDVVLTVVASRFLSLCFSHQLNHLTQKFPKLLLPVVSSGQGREVEAASVPWVSSHSRHLSVLLYLIKG